MTDSPDILSTIADAAVGYPVRTGLIVPDADPSAQADVIDALLLTAKGIFVFEFEDREGWIFGRANQKQWTASLSRTERERFDNPVMRNRAHIRALAAFLGVPERLFRSYIVFSDSCVLKEVPADTGRRCICQRPGLRSRIATDLHERMAVFDMARLRSLEDRLAILSDGSAERIEAALRTCPLCGKPLVARHRASDGSTFIGCSGFPACRYTREGW